MDEKVQIQASGGEVVEFDEKIHNLTKYFQNQQNNKVHLENVPVQALEFIKKLLEAHNYSDETVTWRYPWTSNKLSEHIDSISYELLRVHDKTGKLREEMNDLTELGCILQGLVILELTKFRKVANATLQIPWYCGEKEDEITAYKKFWGWLDVNPTEENQEIREAAEAFQKEIREIREQHKPVFEKIAAQFQKEMDEIGAGK